MNHPEIIIAINNIELGNRIRHVLNNNGYAVLDICTSGNEAIRKVRMLRPEILIVNYELHDTTGLEVARIVSGDKLCSAIVLTNETQKEYVDSVINNMDVICLNKPFNKTLLLNIVELLMRSRKKIKKLENELQDLKKNIETRKIVDKAKKVLMDKLGLSEPDAYRKIQKQSMDSGVAMRDVARIIIDTME
jgi:response regulator NasT